MESKNNLGSIKLKNFGPIKNANINIKPLTVFVGPNSSGKSFTALVIHSLSNPKKEIRSNPEYIFGVDAFNSLIKNNFEAYKEFDSKFKTFVKSNDFSKTFKISSELIKDGIMNQYTEIILNNLKSYFHVEDLSKLKKIGYYPLEIGLNNISHSIGLSFNNISKKFEDLNFTGKTNIPNIIISSERLKNPLLKFDFSKKDIVLVNISPIFLDVMDEIDYAREVYILLGAHFFRSLFGNNSKYIPAARDEIIKNKESIINKELYDLISLSRTQKELATKLLSLNDSTKKSFLYDLAIRMEKKIIHGNIDVKTSEYGYEIVFNDENSNFQSKLDLTISTSIRELACISLYLKYFVKKGDTLIIEEPEAHIHPKNQRILVKYLVEAINSGLNIILTTHSDFIVEEINNLIRLSALSSETVKDLGFSDKNILKPEDINIYLFKEEDEKYSFVPEALEINHTGFNEKEFSKVVDELYDEADHIIESSY